MSQSLEIDNENSIELRFLHTFRFMVASLEVLTSNLSCDQLHSIHTHFLNNGEFHLMQRKGVFPYEYLKLFTKLSDRQLPSREEFFSHLYNKEYALDDYSHAVKVWETLKCETMRDYLELYLVTDVLLLTDVFENFRKISKEIYGLDPTKSILHYTWTHVGCYA